MNTYLVLFIAIADAIVAFVAGWLVSRHIGRGKVIDAEKLAEKILLDAKKEAENLRKEKTLEAKDEIFKLRQNLENEIKLRRSDLQKMENKLTARELNLDRRHDLLTNKEKELDEIENNLKGREERVQKREGELDELIEEQNRRLEKVSGISNEEAKRILMQNLIEKSKQEAAQSIKEIKDRARQQANREAKEIIIQAIQRTAANHSTETTVSVVNLPSDEMKGRIIGREGRNIRSFESATGVEVIVDDTPEAVVLSGFDPFRREIARISLERLVVDGRIHPTRIEEVVEKTKQEMEEKLVEEGEKALMECGIASMHIELVKLLGKLNYRTSYGQNVLQHAVEVSYLTGLMAATLGLDGNLAKRAGLLHDIGKAIDRYTDGTHTQIGLEIAKKYGEGPIVQNAIAAHHEDVEIISPISVLVQAADAVSGSRPGARRETLETYIKRLDSLEGLAKSFAGVGKAYAIQAGREIRVMVEHDKIDDAMSEQLATDIAEKIQNDMEYPGQIKVTVIREYRAIDYAK
ncbi:MAG TPA: ribonuclease Y [bacterium]|nr:MAG: Ribonuclease Y [bacterium ADurb.Bin478]HNY91825.1 ribonuclease Y [bacterium]HPM59039.1 ribonuclease Y [bacterium]